MFTGLLGSGPFGQGDAITMGFRDLLFGLWMAQSLGPHRLLVGGDSSLVIGWMKGERRGPCRLAHFIKEACSLASSFIL